MWLLPFTPRWWRKRQRNIDRVMLFTAIRAQQTTVDQGLRAIWAHIRLDPAWRFPEEWADEPLELEDVCG